MDWGDTLLYDLTLSTERFSVEGGAEMLCHLLARPEWQPTETSRAALRDAALSARVRAALKASLETARLNVEIRARAGRVELAGTVTSAAGRDAATRVASAQAEVLSVENRLGVMQIPLR